MQGAEQIITGPNGSPGLPGSKRVYTDVEPDADMSTVSLQANHSHFVLVGGEGDEGFVKPDPKKARKTLLLEARQRSFNFAHHFEEAVAMYEASLVARPDSSLTLYNLGILRAEAGASAEAEQLYRRAM